ncbi:MAG: hypothetical protein ACK5ML_10195 [Lachnospiraceae bacterium]
MKKMKKWILVVLCLSLFALMAIGSGSSDANEDKEIVTTEAEDSGDAAAADSEGADSSLVSESESVDTAQSVTIEEQILVDQDGIMITAKSYTIDPIWGDGIEVLIENNSDKNVTIGCNALIINNYMITDLFISDIAAGKKANETIYLSSTGLKAAGIESVGQIEIYFRAYDSASYEDIFSTDVVTIQTSEFANMDTTADDSGTELYNADGIRIVGKKVDENSFWGTAILLYIENNSGTNIGVQCNNMSINGFMMTPYFSSDVYAGKKAIDDITILSDELESNGIESVDEVELQFHIYNYDTYETIVDTDPIIFSAQ